MQGTVDRVVPDGKFGFLIGPNGEEYFFHRNALTGVDFEELSPGVHVYFESHGPAPGNQPDEHLRASNLCLTEETVTAVDNELPPPEKIGG